MEEGRNIYAAEAISQVPRLLGILDRNEHSPTYGCFYRPYWHDKITDFPSAHPQLACLVLALIYKHPFPDNRYFAVPKIKKWCIGSMNFWANMQKGDGSFDEHYPNENSFGAAAWTLSSVSECYKLLENEIPLKDRENILEDAVKAARFLSKSNEPGALTNHQAVAAFSLYNMYKITGEEAFKESAKDKINITLSRQSPEGWFVEYNLADLGYLTTTISFLAKYYNFEHDSRVLESLKRASFFATYFIYPDGSYGGVIGSRHTVHFHPHGFELLINDIPQLGVAADAILNGIRRGTCLTPKDMDDKHFPNLQIEFLNSYLDYTPRPKVAAAKENIKIYFEDAKIFVMKNQTYHLVLAAGKGGVLKIFGPKDLIYSDAGFIGLYKKKLVTTQWQDASNELKVEKDKITIEGKFHELPSSVLSPLKMILSRLFLLTLGRSPKISFFVKKSLIKKLITESPRLDVGFRREIVISGEEVLIKDTLKPTSGFSSLELADVFYPIFVPSSRFFLSQELLTSSIDIPLSKCGNISITRKVTPDIGNVEVVMEEIDDE